jgi:hypothetical protein
VPTILVLLRPKPRRSYRPGESNLLLTLDLNLLGRATTSKGAGISLATADPQPAKLTFFELPMKGDAGGAPTAVGALGGKVRLDAQKVVFDAGGAALSGGGSGGYALDLEWGKAFQNVAAGGRLVLPAALDFKAEAGTLELGCTLEVGGATEFKYRYDPTDPKKKDDFVSISMHLLAAPKLEVYDDATILSELAAQHQAVKKAYAPSTVVALRSPGNGEKPVFALVPPKFDPAKPFKVQTHYHGLGSSVQAGPHLKRLRDLLAPEAPLVVVVPEGRKLVAGDKTPRERWNNVADQRQTTRDAEAAVQAALKLSAWNVAERHVSMHSAGGDVLRRLAKLNPSSGLEADSLQLLDCLYNNDDLGSAGFPGVTDAAIALGKTVGSKNTIYRRAENADTDTPGGPKRGELVLAALGASRFTIFDLNDRTKHDETVKFLGEPS